MLELFDSHCHLDEEAFQPELDVILHRAQEQGVQGFLVPGYSPQYWPRLQQLQRVWPDRVWLAYGIHPCYVYEIQGEDTWSSLASYLAEAVAVGEVGLDRGLSAPPLSAQYPVLERQLNLARALGLPVVLHARQSTEELLQFLRPWRGLRGVFHSFSGSREQAHQVLDLGFHLGIGGSITYPRARRLRELVRTLPAASLLLETDAPWQSPYAHRRQRNEPGYLPEILQALADLRDEDPRNLAGQCSANARKLFSKGR
ncbi:MAG: TatD family hydrolase [Acidithiobacillus sp.]|nr:TatD family hydrolase [Acidithiobacillus sp.]